LGQSFAGLALDGRRLAEAVVGQKFNPAAPAGHNIDVNPLVIATQFLEVYLTFAKLLEILPP
jgi:hypothetical protein